MAITDIRPDGPDEAPKTSLSDFDPREKELPEWAQERLERFRVAFVGIEILMRHSRRGRPCQITVSAIGEKISTDGTIPSGPSRPLDELSQVRGARSLGESLGGKGCASGGSLAEQMIEAGRIPADERARAARATPTRVLAPPARARGDGRRD